MVIVLPTINDTFLLHLIQNVDELEAVDSQLHCDGAKAKTIGMVGKQLSNLFFHCYQFLSFLYLYYNR